ncbi:TPA: hypothetical protein N0F65_003116 [Lagenidium giganteum]|uniref:Ankyrin n=1 Tax=Lagenidium giganteum TaxID=4803 RepID=A0AAV2YVG8_9STRA|nr:TPA: hypothetical protein N0F65_003116 [Lagenidium giganteum]
MIDFFHQAGADIHTVANDGQNLLHAVLGTGNYSINGIVAAVLRKGVDASAKTHAGVSVAAHAILENVPIEVFTTLVQGGADVTDPDTIKHVTFREAARYDCPEMMNALFTQETDVNEMTDDGYTLLYECVLNGHARAVHFLIEHGASVNKTVDDDAFPLYAAAENGHLPIVKMLIEAGADVNQTTVRSFELEVAGT